MPIPIGPEIGSSAITLQSPNGSYATFNAPADINYVGMVTDITGLDSPEIREDAENRPATDGGLHGSFLFGRRPITLAGKILSPTTVTDRRVRMDRLQRCVLNCMRSDGLLYWYSGAQQVFARVRVQQPLRITGTWQKDFQIALVAEDPKIYSVNTVTTPQASAGTGILITNEGSASAPPIITLKGATSSPLVIHNQTLLRTFNANFSSTAGQTIVVDMANKTVTRDGENMYSTFSGNWWELAPGVNSIQAQGSGATGNTISWSHRHAWY